MTELQLTTELPALSPDIPVDDVPESLHAGQESDSQASLNHGSSVALRRVLHVINGEHYAGAEKVQDLLGLGLGACGFEVAFACLKPENFPVMRQSQEATLLEATMRSRLDLRPAFQLAREIREGGYELVHTHTPRAALVGQLAARLAKVPLVHHVHGQTLVEVGRRGISWISAKVERMSLRRASRLIAVSSSSANYLCEQGFDRDRIAIVPNGVPTPFTMRTSSPPRTGWTIGTIALFRPRKGTEVLLQAIASLRQQGLPVRLKAIGGFETAEYEATVRAHVASLNIADAVEFIGFRQDVAAELTQLDAMVLPSLLAEGLPMVIIESMAAGVPVVGTRVPGITDVIRHDVDGLLAEPNNADALAEQLSRLIHHEVDWSFLRENALSRHAEQYSSAAMARGVADIYREVLAE